MSKNTEHSASKDVAVQDRGLQKSFKRLMEARNLC